jgi:hypothetical protein
MERKVDEIKGFVMENMGALFEHMEEYQSTTELGFKSA